MLKTNEYHGNAYQKHILLKQLIHLEEEHIIRWRNLFQDEAVIHVLDGCRINHPKSLINYGIVKIWSAESRK